MIVCTPRLVLREFEEEDWQAVLAYQSDPRYLRYYPWTMRTPEDVRAFVAMLIGWRDASPRTKYQLAITLRPEGTPAGDEQGPGALIGAVGVRKPEQDATTAEMGYELAPDRWGRGYATEAAAAMVRFAFVDLGLHRVTANCIAENAASARVMQRLGMRCEARLRETDWFKGRWWDSFIYGILDREWWALHPEEPSSGGARGDVA